MKQLAKRIILSVARRSQLLKRIAAFIVANTLADSIVAHSYEVMREKFIRNGKNSRYGETIRSEIVSKFEHIDRELPIASTPTDGLFLAEMLLNMEAGGAIIECGSFAGASSAKLSIISKLLERQLIVFDSFEGLPAVTNEYLKDKHCRQSDEWVTNWDAGRYAASLDEVQNNINCYGEPSVCKLVKGWFTETLTEKNLPSRVAFAFVDVDLANSAKECFVAIWPRLSAKGIYATHDAAYIKVLQEFYKPELWRDKWSAVPPVLFGAGYGLCNDSPHLGYMVKGESLSPDYLKRLTLNK